VADALLRSAPRVVENRWLRLLPPATRFILRGERAACAAAGNAFGVTIAGTACRAAAAGARAALWLGPDEHLLLAPAEDGTALASSLPHALTGIAHSLVDVSHRQVGLAVHGPHAAHLLNGGCPLDLDPREFPAGGCTRTVFGKSEIVLWRTADDGFRLEVWRSFAGYVADLLVEISRELPA
jgi:sarcosine oxidase subunit gamma